MGWNIFKRRQSPLQQLGVRGFEHIPEPYRRAHKHSIRNQKEISISETCGCFYCVSTFSPATIKDWVSDGEKTAMCPNCGIDSVIGAAAGYPLTSDFLQKMNEYWFS